MELKFLSKERNTSKDLLRVHQFVFIEQDHEKLIAELFKWGVAEWWPGKVEVRYSREGGEIAQQGQKVTLDILKPWILKFEGEVVYCDQKGRLEVDFQKGFLRARELLTLEERSNGVRIDYLMQLAAQSLSQKFIWKLFFQKRFEKNLKEIFKALKHFVEAREKN